MSKTIRIGGACAFVGDSIIGPRQLVEVEGMQYLVFDYLAEMTLSGFAHARKSNPAAGFATEFIDVTLQEILPLCMQRGIRLVANAGGLNPRGCAEAIEALARELGCAPRVAFIEGDDCLPLLPALRSAGTQDFYSGTPMPRDIENANVYLGAVPIARALDLGADIVVTGRIVDSATTLGVLMHEFGWAPEAYDLLAAGSLAGHILECGAQATGGIFTDWEQIPDWENIGYPYVDVADDGCFTVCKPTGTGGKVTPAVVSEQILYEVGDPANYILPDVICDFTRVVVTQDGEDRVRVQGARGLPPPSTYKLSATYQQGYRCISQVSIFGVDAVKKARRTGDALLQRVRNLFEIKSFGDFEKVSVTVLGAEDSYGPHANAFATREAVARIAVTHSDKNALEIFSRESRAPGVSFAPGTTSGSALTLNGRPAVEPRYRLFSCLVPKEWVAVPRVILNGEEIVVPISVSPVSVNSAAAVNDAIVEDFATAPRSEHSAETAPLIALAHGRSGDKGDSSNIAIIARRPEDLPLLRRELTVERVRAYLGHLVHGEVMRYEVPGLNALNFLLTEALDGGGPTSLRTDPMGKGMAQMLLGMPIAVPRN
jgi:acyclic terpene utilization AtuA family protein